MMGLYSLWCLASRLVLVWLVLFTELVTRQRWASSSQTQVTLITIITALHSNTVSTIYLLSTVWSLERFESRGHWAWLVHVSRAATDTSALGTCSETRHGEISAAHPHTRHIVKQTVTLLLNSDEVMRGHMPSLVCS